MSKESKLLVFAHLRQAWRPCGQLLMTEEGPEVQASSFAYGLTYARQADALEVDPVSLSPVSYTHLTLPTSDLV